MKPCEFRNIDINDMRVMSEAVECLRGFIADPNKIGVRDVFKYPGNDDYYYEVWETKRVFIVQLRDIRR